MKGVWILIDFEQLGDLLCLRLRDRTSRASLPEQASQVCTKSPPAAAWRKTVRRHQAEDRRQQDERGRWLFRNPCLDAETPRQAWGLRILRESRQDGLGQHLWRLSSRPLRFPRVVPFLSSAQTQSRSAFGYVVREQEAVPEGLKYA